jgi:Arc/MetJ family transcription regulator
MVLDVYNSDLEYTFMRTNIVIDDRLMRETLHATGLKTKRRAVEEGLRTLLRLSRQAEIRQFRGKLHWQGDLDAMRSDR